MRDSGGRHDADDLEVGGLDREVIEEADALTEEQGTRSMWISSTSPALRACWSTVGVPISTSFSPAACFAWRMALDAIGDEHERRSLMRPIIGDGVCQHEAGRRRRVAAPCLGDVEVPATGDHRPARPARVEQDLGALLETLSVGDPGIGISVSPLKYQRNSWLTSSAGPATNPSTETVM